MTTNTAFNSALSSANIKSSKYYKKDSPTKITNPAVSKGRINLLATAQTSKADSKPNF